MGSSKCPECGSTNIAPRKKGWDMGATAIGGLLAGPIGLLAGGLEKDKTILVCLDCGHQWVLRKRNEGFLERMQNNRIDSELGGKSKSYTKDKNIKKNNKNRHKKQLDDRIRVQHNIEKKISKIKEQLEILDEIESNRDISVRIKKSQLKKRLKELKRKKDE